MAGHPDRNLSVRCAVSQSERATCEKLQRGSPTATTSATSITAMFSSWRSKIMRGRHDNHRGSESTSGQMDLDPLRSGRLDNHRRYWQRAKSDRAALDESCLHI